MGKRAVSGKYGSRGNFEKRQYQSNRVVDQNVADVIDVETQNITIPSRTKTTTKTNKRGGTVTTTTKVTTYEVSSDGTRRVVGTKSS